MVASPATPAPSALVSPSADPSRTNELVAFEAPYTTKAYGEPSFAPPMPTDVLNDLSRCLHVSSIQTMSQTNPIAHHLDCNTQTSMSRSYEADLARMKNDLADLFNSIWFERG